MKNLSVYTALMLSTASIAQAQTIRILMETVPDTEYIQELLPEFEAKTGIDVELEVIGYSDMHAKLIPQMIAGKGSYDAIVVDFYWVGEFTQAGWLSDLDPMIEADGVDLTRYVPKLLDLVGKVDGTSYMLPFYNYSMGLIYRQDLISDVENQAAFKAEYGIDLAVPETWSEYLKQVDFFTRDEDNDGTKELYGTVIQGQRGDCVSMQWSNYLFGNGGRYLGADNEPLMNSPEAIAAMTDYRKHVVSNSPPGSESFCFDEAFNVMAQGRAYSLLTFNIMYAGFEDEKSSSVAGKVGIAPNPGGGLNGAWGWAIPKSSPNKDAAWEFLKWVESPEIATRRALLGGAPTQSAIFDNPEIIAARPYYPTLRKILQGAKDFPIITYTSEFVERTGLELNLAATGAKSVEDAMNEANKALRELLVRDGKIAE